MERIDRFTVPESREERVTKMKEAAATLKKEFVGLDDIIDKICEAMTPWYVTPEIISRPTVVSLWGMTGTGKTSVVRRLTSLLGLSNKTIFFDCGEESNNGSTTVASKINDVMFLDEDNNPEGDKVNDFVFVFDEFQHARTINERGEEVDKANLRSVWNLIDTGIIKSDVSNWETTYFIGFLEDFEGYVEEYPEVPLVDGKIVDPKDVENLLNSIGYFYYDRGVPGIMSRRNSQFGMSSAPAPAVEDKDLLEPVSVVEERILRGIVRKLRNCGGLKMKPKDIVDDIFSAKTTNELLEKLKEIKNIVIAPKDIDCNKSIIFILGNLDEAFKVEGDINPDVDADIFYDETSKVTITDIKRSLKKRFRAEQIARFGNSIIKYPTLKREHFEKVIKNELERITSEFKSISGINLILDGSIYDLIYFEGVYPVQGVRPVFTTINTIFTPILSDILMMKEDGVDSARLSVVDPELGYKFDKKGILIEVGKKSSTREVDMVLGSLRKPESTKTRYINAVHEAGHAVVKAYLTGKAPTSIVAVSSDSGGFCVTYDPDKTGEIKTKWDVDVDVMISLGGYLAEELIFPNSDKTLLGSGNDISQAWESLSDAAYNLGYFHPMQFSNYETWRNDRPGGVDDQNGLKKKLEHTLVSLKIRAQEILRENTDLIVNIALDLGEAGEFSGETFMKFVESNKGTLTPESMRKAREYDSYEYYKNQLLLRKK